MNSNNSNKGVIMATYECPKCEMSVNATCGKCNEPLVNDMLKLDDGKADSHYGLDGLFNVRLVCIA